MEMINDQNNYSKALQTLVDNMRAQDADKPTSSQYKLNWGTKLGSNPKPSGKEYVSEYPLLRFLEDNSKKVQPHTLQ